MPTHDRVRGIWAYYSLDVANSTLLKIKRPHEWANLIVNFLQMSPRVMDRRWSGERASFDQKLRAKPGGLALDPSVSPPKLWKLLGDEVLFVQEFEEANPTEFLYSVGSFVAVLRDLRRALGSNIKGWPFELRGTVWLANEARNRRINPDAVVDYLGPGIDLGFRIKPYAGFKQIAFSIEAAYLLALGLTAMNDDSATELVNDGLPDEQIDGFPDQQIAAPVIYLAGDVLPGVFLSEMAYPKILLRILPWRPSEHRRLINKRGPITAKELETTCREWIRREKRRLFNPLKGERPTGYAQPRDDSRARPYDTGPLTPPPA